MGENAVTPIAVIGMACRLPGGIDSPEQLWDTLLQGVDHVTEIPADRWDAEEYYDPEPGVPGRSVSKWGAFLEDIAGFDADFFSINEREATAIDPQHRLLLETSWEAVEHAGLDPAALAGSVTGVFIGLTHNDYQLMAADARSLEGPYGFTGSNFSLASGRIAYALGVHGPALTVDSACSSGLLAIHMACRSLDDGESDMALAGGASVMLEPRKAASGSAQGMLSPTGKCHAFDVNADGFVSGEGSAVVLLKRLDDAVRDGDRVLAVIRGTAANQDGHTINIAVPSETAQVSAYRSALSLGDVDPATVGMVEAHGTGTPVGDPIEYASLAQVYGQNGPCALASVKTNFGHGQSASGAIGLMKTVLSLQHGVVPQNLHFTKLPDEMVGIDTNLFVPQENTPWPLNGGLPRRAAVSSYGLSGTNVHAVLEQAPERTEQVTEADRLAAPAGPLVFPVSSSSAEELCRTCGRLADWLTERLDGPGSDTLLTDLAYTLTRRRAHRSVRTAVTAGSAEELIASLREIADSGTPFQPAVGDDKKGPVWLFSGQGSQWIAMGAELLAKEPVFAATVAELEPLIAAESGFSVTEAISSSEPVTGIAQIQPTLFTMQVALAATTKSYGVTPGAVIGHSMGEVAAAVVAGALSMADAVKVICRRSKLMARISGSGAMASVELPASQVLSELAARGVNDVVLSVVASPTSTVVGGATQSIRDLVREWDERGVMAREVAVDVASHSPQVDPILDELIEVLSDIEPLTPEIPYFSATMYDPRDEPYMDADYWADNLRHAVRFAAAVQAALEDGYRVFAEMAPHPLLTHPVEQTARGLDISVAPLAAMRREAELPMGLRPLIADLHSAGAAVDFSVLNPAGELIDAPLPTWTHRPLLLVRESQDGQSQGGHVVTVHPLLGAHVLLPEDPPRHVWQADVGLLAQPWLGDHQVHNVAALPGAAYCEMAIAVARAVLGEDSEIRDITFDQMLLLDDQTTVSTVATEAAPGVVELLVETSAEGERIQRAGAVLHKADLAETSRTLDVEHLLATHPNRIEGADMRDTFEERDIQYGPAFSGLSAAYTPDAPAGSVLAEVSLPGSIRSQQGAYNVHPALLDACFQAVAAYADNQREVGLLLPLGVRRIRAYSSTRNAHYCYLQVTTVHATGLEADIDVLDENGTVLLSIQGLQLGTGISESGQRNRVLNERLLTLEWQAKELAADEGITDAHWLLIASDEADPVAAGLAEKLKVGRTEVSTMVWPVGGQAGLDDELRRHFAGSAVTGLVVVAPAGDGSPEQAAERGQQHVQHVVHIARELPEIAGDPPRLYVITTNAQAVLPDDQINLGQAGLRGLVRVIGTEQPHLRATQIDIDGDTDIATVAEQLRTDSDEDESAWRAGQWYVARLSLGPLSHTERHITNVDYANDGVRVEVRTPGDLQSTELVTYDRVAPGPGEIEVAIGASTLNFADVLVAFGRYPSFEGRTPVAGTDFAGVVTAVGPDVTEHKVGDRVGGWSGSGCWSTFAIVDSQLATKVPDGMSITEAAAIITAHATAWYSLHDLAKIAAGDKVLIHSGTGGVGLAAIAIARAAGAEIFATAGNDRRRQVLRDMGIEHVYDSRSPAFKEQIKADTDGYGVDIVLNSLTGASQRAGLETLAFGGRFLEIGKRDIYGDTKLGQYVFRRNIAFFAVDLALMSLTNPEKVQGILRGVYERVASGELPMPEFTTYPLADTATAIRVMSGAEHTGKLVLEVPHEGQSDVPVPPEWAPAFRKDGSYIISGGLGGLGLFLAETMSEGGCGRIVLTSRSRPNVKAEETIELIRAAGGDIVVECGDITDPEVAARVVAAATATGLPVRGVLHAAAVVEDATLTNITDQLVERDWAPKAVGAWNLHTATLDEPLDWFCTFSSAAALVGSPGQGAYSAANSWVDGFTHWRRSQGLPATAIAWGAWAEIGRGAGFAESIDVSIEPDEGAYAFETLLRYNRAYTGYAPLVGTAWLTEFAKRSPFAEAFQKMGQGKSDSSEFLAELETVPMDEWPARLRRLVSDQISMILRRTIDPDRPLSEYGIDSLGNLEVRTRIETETGVRVNPTEITTVRALADRLCEKLSEGAASAAS